MADEQSGEQSVSRHQPPAVTLTLVRKIPEVFSFSACTVKGCSLRVLVGKFYQEIVPRVNKVLGGAQLDRSPKFSQQAQVLIAQLREQLGKSETLDEAMWQLTVELELAGYALQATQNRTVGQLATIQTIIKERSGIHWTTALGWYHAVCLHLQYQYQYNEVAMLEYAGILCRFSESKTDEKHGTAILIFIVNTLNQSTCYPSDAVMAALRTVHSDETLLQAVCVQARHRYVRSFCQYREYSELTTSPLLTRLDTRLLEMPVFIIASEDSLLATPAALAVETTPSELFKFACHLAPLMSPGVYLEVPGLDGPTEEVFNAHFRQKMVQKKLCTTEGVLKESWLNYAKKLQSCLEEASSEAGLAKPGMPQMDVIQRGLPLDAMQEQYKILQQLIKAQEGFCPVKSLLFYARSLESQMDGAFETVRPIHHAVVQCLHLAYEAKALYEQHGQHTTAMSLSANRGWFALAQSVLQWIQQGKCCVLQTGTPIKGGTTYSEHAFYISFSPSKTTGYVDIVISNAGLGVDVFHQKAACSQKGDRSSYHYAGFEPVHIEKQKDALLHYLFKVISTPYTRAEIGVEKEHPFHFDSLLYDLYHATMQATTQGAPREIFYGFAAKNVPCFKRRDLEACFLEQPMGTCTVYNLKEALTQLFHLDVISRGLLDDCVFRGFDQLLPSVLGLSPDGTRLSPVSDLFATTEHVAKMRLPGTSASSPTSAFFGPFDAEAGEQLLREEPSGAVKKKSVRFAPGS